MAVRERSGPQDFVKILKTTVLRQPLILEEKSELVEGKENGGMQNKMTNMWTLKTVKVGKIGDEETFPFQ